MIKAIAIDDEPPALKVLQGYCRKTERIELVACFSQPALGLNYLSENRVGLVFLDIQMPGTSGLKIAKEISADTTIVFTTAFEEHALEGYNLNAIDYLLKPFSFNRFNQAIDKVLRLASTIPTIPERNYITVRSDYSLVKLQIEEICYLEAMDDYVKFFLDAPLKPLVVRTTMKSITDILPKIFLRVHRSFIVNVEKINGARKGVVIIKDKHIPIGVKYNQEIAMFIKGMKP